jgi:hypothetical protein
MQTLVRAVRSTDFLGRLCLFLIAAGLVAFTFEYGRITYGLAFLEKYAPDWTILGFVRFATSATAAFLIFLAVRDDRADCTMTTPLESPYAHWAALIANGALVASGAIVIFNPDLLNETVREGQFLSILTEIILLGAVVVFGICVWRSRKIPNLTILWMRPSVVFSSMMIICALIAMEEMSWGQHWIGWEAGALFANNAQSETNLHNFATYKFEAAYYSAAIIAFILIPAFWSDQKYAHAIDISYIVPNRRFALAGLPIAGLMFEEWNIQIYQVWFFLAIFAGLWLSSMRDKSPQTKWFAIAATAALFVSQAIFLTFGSAMVDGYELSEIREFLIALVIASYALLMHHRLLISTVVRPC